MARSSAPQFLWKCVVLGFALHMSSCFGTLAKMSGQVVNPQEFDRVKTVAVFTGIVGSPTLMDRAVGLADTLQAQAQFEGRGRVEFLDREIIKQAFPLSQASNLPRGTLPIMSPWEQKSVLLVGPGRWSHRYAPCDSSVVREVRSALQVDAFLVFWLCEDFRLGAPAQSTEGWIGAQLFSAADGSEIWHGGRTLSFGNQGIAWLAMSLFPEQHRK